MKTSKAQQAQTRQQIVSSAVLLMSRHGFDGVSMKDIARDAGIGDATIYKYFPTKERLILGYIDAVVADAVAATLATPGIDGDELQSQLQRLTDALLERLLPDREFVILTRALMSRSPLLLLGDQLAAKAVLRRTALGFIEAAQLSGEVPHSEWARWMAGLYADYCMGVVAFWLADESAEFTDTTRWVDQTLGVFVLVLKSGLLDRLAGLAGFWVRSQLARWATASPKGSAVWEGLGGVLAEVLERGRRGAAAGGERSETLGADEGQDPDRPGRRRSNGAKGAPKAPRRAAKGAT